MTKLQRNILIGAVIFGVIGGILWAIVQFTGGEEVVVPGEATDIVELPEVVTNTGEPIEAPAEEVPETQLSDIPVETQLKRLARNFAERYGSFSNQNDFENLENLAGFMSTDFNDQTEAFVNARRILEDPNAPYYGITTKVVSVKTGEFNEEAGHMVVNFITRRTETDVAAGTTRTFDQDAQLVFVREDDRWLVNSFDFTNG